MKESHTPSSTERERESGGNRERVRERVVFWWTGLFQCLNVIKQNYKLSDYIKDDNDDDNVVMTVITVITLNERGISVIISSRIIPQSRLALLQSAENYFTHTFPSFIIPLVIFIRKLWLTWFAQQVSVNSEKPALMTVRSSVVFKLALY